MDGKDGRGDDRPPDAVEQHRWEKKTLAWVVGVVAAIGAALLAAGIAIDLAGKGDSDPARFVVMIPFLVTLALLVGAPYLIRRRRRARQERVLGATLEIDILRADPRRLEGLRARVVSVGVIRTGDMDGGTTDSPTRELVESFVITHDGDTVDVESHTDPSRIVSRARWLAIQLDVPLVDGRDSLHRTFTPDELPGLDDDLRRVEGEAESETESESGSESETEPETAREDPDVERARRAARARQRS